MPTSIRRGLPRVRGGEPWPPADTVVALAENAAHALADAPAHFGAGVPPTQSAGEDVSHPTSASAEALASAASAPAASAPAASALPTSPMRRGLPRVRGGEPWPPADVAGIDAAAVTTPPTQSASAASNDPTSASAEVGTPSAPPTHKADAVPANPSSASAERLADAGGVAIRRGLPRVRGGEAWPPSDTVPRSAPAPVAAVPAPAAPAPAAPAPTAPAPAAAADPDAARAASVAEPTPVASADVVPAERGTLAPLPFTPTAWPGVVPRIAPAPAPEPTRIRGLTTLQWAGAVIGGGLALLVAAFLVVMITRWVVSLDGMQDFLTTYPGETHLPEGAPVGFPAWLGWQHFFNVFLMVLIIRSGLQVRGEKRPTMFWSPRNNPKRKISITLWLHQALDILWIVNGVVFVVLLFATGQWMRVVPTSWEVFPNALSAVIQYVSLEWPTENGWVNYNSLQVLAYFTTIFVAAPLAIVTGVRMSGVWPKNATRLNTLYPVEWARAVHFPVMLYFVAFIIVHVALVFATGALRNLNHMYAAQGSADPDAYAMNWVGFWIFVASMAVIIAGWIAARPIVLAGIARAFGKVSGR